MFAAWQREPYAAKPTKLACFASDKPAEEFVFGTPPRAARALAAELSGPKPSKCACVTPDKSAKEFACGAPDTCTAGTQPSEIGEFREFTFGAPAQPTPIIALTSCHPPPCFGDLPIEPEDFGELLLRIPSGTKLQELDVLMDELDVQDELQELEVSLSDSD